MPIKGFNELNEIRNKEGKNYLKHAQYSFWKFEVAR